MVLWGVAIHRGGRRRYAIVQLPCVRVEGIEVRRSWETAFFVMLVWWVAKLSWIGHVTCMISYYRVYSHSTNLIHHMLQVPNSFGAWHPPWTWNTTVPSCHHTIIKPLKEIIEGGGNNHDSCHRVMRIIRVIAGSWEVINVINSHHFLLHPPLDHCHLCHVQGHPFAVPPLQE